MNVFHLLKQEISYRFLMFAVSLLLVMVFAGILVAQLTVIRIHEYKTNVLLAGKENQMSREMTIMEREFIRITKEYGYNLVILPKEQDLCSFYDEGYANRLMPQEYVTVLQETVVSSVRDLVPSLERKIRWTEQHNRSIILIGTPWVGGKLPVQKGEVVVGYELANSLGIIDGGKIQLNGLDFDVIYCADRTGTREDITLWISLVECQNILCLNGMINSIKATEMMVPGSNPIDSEDLKSMITAVLPGTQVLILENEVTILRETLEKARAVAFAALQTERDSRERHLASLKHFTVWLIPVIGGVSVALFLLLTILDTRERQKEIAILRAIGFHTDCIRLLFYMKFTLSGFLGGFLGAFFGTIIAAIIGMRGMVYIPLSSIIHFPAISLTCVSYPIIAIFTASVPIICAANTDPAEIIRKE